MTRNVEPEPARTSPEPESRIRTYARLAKLDVYDYYLSILVVASLVLLPPAALFPEAIPVLVLFLLGEIATIVTLVALDDLTGYRDGSDITNYGPDDPFREKRRKPLVAGTLTTAQVVRSRGSARRWARCCGPARWPFRLISHCGRWCSSW